jgi:uncharacterized membrane protein HdeD (DUF308 family)
MLLTGVLAIAIPPVAGIAVPVVVARLLVQRRSPSGIRLAYANRGRTGMGAAAGHLSIFVGVYALLHPGAGLTSLRLVLAIYLFTEGVLKLILSFRLRPMPGSNWLLFDGIIPLILAILIWRSWPSSTEWVIGTRVGISMLFSGAARLSLSLAARRVLTKSA